MAKVFYLHWNREEAQTRSAPLRAGGHDVHVHWSTAVPPALQGNLPELAILSLDRLPSHSRAVAEWLWEAKKRQHIPIVFEGGEPSKRAVAKAKFPRAHFCETGRFLALVARLSRSSAQPSRPRGTSGRSIARAPGNR